MSFFSLVQLERTAFKNREGQGEWRRLSAAGAAYRDHCLLWRLFPAGGDSKGTNPGNEHTPQTGQSSEPKPCFIYRLRDTAQADTGLTVQPLLSYYVVSAQPPRPVPGMLTVAAKAYDPALQPGETVHFQLRANPSTAHKREPFQADGPTRKLSVHHDVLMHAKKNSDANQAEAMAAASAWLAQRASRWGLQLHADQLFCDGYTQHRLHRRGESIAFSSLDYSGIAQVSDPALLRTAMLEGVGRKRAFGCGLLLIRRME